MEGGATARAAAPKKGDAVQKEEGTSGKIRVTCENSLIKRMPKKLRAQSMSRVEMIIPTEGGGEGMRGSVIVLNMLLYLGRKKRGEPHYRIGGKKERHGFDFS